MCMLNKGQKIILALTRVAIGWLFFYAGITKVANPEWSAKGYLENAETFSSIYTWFASPTILPITNFLNQWGLTIIGIALILGIFVRLSSVLGALLMLLYFFPVLNFPYAGDHSFLVDDHIIYILVFAILFYFNAGMYYGLEKIRRRRDKIR